MSIINCSANCIYEDNGNCTLDHVNIISCTNNQDCGFFQERKKNNQKSFDMVSKSHDPKS